MLNEENRFFNPQDWMHRENRDKKPRLSELQMREKYPAVQEAYDKYKVVLELHRHEK